jgi:hypothetical protein
MSSTEFRPLSPEGDRNIGFLADRDYRFARSMQTVALASDELGPVMSIMPVLLQRLETHWQIQGVMCLHGTPNLLLGPGGKWQSFYIPRFLKLYPLALDPADSEPPVLGLCETSTRLSQSHENKLIDSDGQTTETYQKIVTALVELRQDSLRCSVLIESLFQAGLLFAVQAQNVLVPADAQYHTVDRPALDALDADVLKSLQQTGALDIFFAVFYSRSNANRFRAIAVGRAGRARASKAKAEGDGLDGMLAPAEDAGFNFDI